jgi:hypothetical protein
LISRFLGARCEVNYFELEKNSLPLAKIQITQGFFYRLRYKNSTLEVLAPTSAVAESVLPWRG